MMLNYLDVSLANEHREEILQEVTANRLGRRLRREGARRSTATSRRGLAFLTVALGAALVAVAALAGMAGQADASGADVSDYFPAFSADGQWIAYTSNGVQTTNPEGDWEVYRMSAQGGMGPVSLSNNGAGVSDDFSSTGIQVDLGSYGKQASNPEGDSENTA